LKDASKDLGSDARSFVALMLSNITEANNQAASNTDKIDATEYQKLKNSPLFTNPTGLLSSIVNENKDLGTYIYRWVGPSAPASGNPDGRKWYTDWSPWHNQSMRWAALSSLNNLMPSNYISNPNVAVYDAYFTMNGARITQTVPPDAFTSNPVAKITLEMYNTSDVAQVNATLRVKKDNNANNYSLDQTVATTTFSIDQNPLNYGGTVRVKKELSFQTSVSDLSANHGYYFELVDNANSKVFFTSAFKEYQKNLSLAANYNNIYDMYGQWPNSLGIQGNMNSLTFSGTQILEGGTCDGYYLVNGVKTNQVYLNSFQSAKIEAVSNSGLSFACWSDGITDNPRQLFVKSPTTLIAKYKAHLGSSTLQATANNSQRKIGGNQYLVYESANAVWCTNYTGSTWSNEVLVSTPGMVAKNPSIAYTNDYNSGPAKIYVHVVWEEIDPSYPDEHTVCYRRLRLTPLPQQWEPIITLDGSIMQMDATPVVEAFASMPPVVVVWKSGEPGYTRLMVQAEPSSGINAQEISGTDPDVSQVAMTPAWINKSDGPYMGFYLAYLKGTTIYRKGFTSSGYEESPIVITSGNSCANPSIIGRNQSGSEMNVVVAWDALDAGTRRVYCKERNASGVWQTSSYIPNNEHQSTKPSLSFDNLPSKFDVLFQSDAHVGLAVRDISSGSWSPVADLGTGSNPNTGVWVTGSAVPYTINIAPLIVQSISGTIASNTTWSGVVNVTGTVTINSGVTLTILPGTVVIFASGTQLIINGILNANGSASQRIAFDRSASTGTWGGIRFNNITSYSSISYCDIANASTAIYLYNSSCLIIHHNTISGAGSYGINCQSYSSPCYIYNNRITGRTGAGVTCNSYSSPMLSNSTGTGHNVIIKNGRGVEAGLNSAPLLGLLNGPGGYNCIHNNTSVQVYSFHNPGTIYAENNWWNRTSSPYYIASDFYAEMGYGPIDYIPSLSSDPNGCTGLQKVSTSENSIANNPTSQPSTPDAELTQFMKLELEGKDKEAIAGYVQRFKKETSKETKKYLLARLAECYRRSDGKLVPSAKKDFTDFLNKKVRQNISNSDELYATTLEVENMFLLKEGNYEGAIENFKTLRSTFSKNKDIHQNALFNLGYLYYYQLVDSAKGKEYFDELKANYPNDELTQQAMLMLGEIDSVVFKGLGKEAELVEKIEIPNHYELSQNYPNPFNPTTTIHYQIPNAGHVMLKVYDMLGREVATLVDEMKESGFYTIVFHAEKLASGMYIARLTAQSEEGKPQGGKSFVQTKKMLLMK